LGKDWADWAGTPWLRLAGDILYVPPIPQQIQISVDQPYAGPAASCCGIIGTHSIYSYQHLLTKQAAAAAAAAALLWSIFRSFSFQ
jgi:hypothetical protein